MLFFMLGLAVGVVVTAAIMAVMAANIHTHKYEILFHRPADELNISYRWTVYGYEVEKGMKIDTSKVYVTYKKCSKCGDTILSLGNGSDRDFHYDAQFIANKVELILKEEAKAENDRLLRDMDRRIVNDDRVNEIMAPLAEYQKRLQNA